MKQKIVLEVLMPCSKCQMRAKEIAALTEGMKEMVIDEAKNQLVIVGVGVDIPVLATKLGKKVGRTTIISVEVLKSEEKKKEEETAKKKKKEEEEKKKKEAARNGTVTWSYYDQSNNYPRPPPGFEVVYYGAPYYSNSWLCW